MNTCVNPSLSFQPRASGLLAALRHAWQQWCMDPRTRYLSQATDLPDLERRLRAWDRG